MTTTGYTSQDDEYGSPIEVTDGGVRCGNHFRDWKIRHENAAAVRDCYAISKQIMDEQRGELYAEGVMSWVAGGGSPDDAGRYARVYASGRTWDGGIDEGRFSGRLCEHQMAAELCEGPEHYMSAEQERAAGW